MTDIQYHNHSTIVVYKLMRCVVCCVLCVVCCVLCVCVCVCVCVFPPNVSMIPTGAVKFSFSVTVELFLFRNAIDVVTTTLAISEVDRVVVNICDTYHGWTQTRA